MGVRRNRWLTDGEDGWIARPKDAVPDFGGSNVAHPGTVTALGRIFSLVIAGLLARSREWELMPVYRTGEAAKRTAEMRESR